MKKEDKETIFRYIRDIWEEIPLNEIYCSSISEDIYHPIQDDIKFFVYLTNNSFRAEFIKLEKVKSNFFEVYKFQVIGYNLTIGYLFIPTKVFEPWIVRYTPYMVSVTNPDMSKEVVENSTRQSLFKSDKIELLSLSCGCEVIQTLSFILGVNLAN